MKLFLQFTENKVWETFHSSNSTIYSEGAPYVEDLQRHVEIEYETNQSNDEDNIDNHRRYNNMGENHLIYIADSDAEDEGVNVSNTCCFYNTMGAMGNFYKKQSYVRTRKTHLQNIRSRDYILV